MWIRIIPLVWIAVYQASQYIIAGVLCEYRLVFKLLFIHTDARAERGSNRSLSYTCWIINGYYSTLFFFSFEGAKTNAIQGTNAREKKYLVNLNDLLKSILYCVCAFFLCVFDLQSIRLDNLTDFFSTEYHKAQKNRVSSEVIFVFIAKHCVSHVKVNTRIQCAQNISHTTYPLVCIRLEVRYEVLPVNITHNYWRNKTKIA